MKKLFKKVVGYAAFALAALVPALSANAVTKTFYYDDSSTNYRNSRNSTGVAVHIWQAGGPDYPNSPIEGTVVGGTDGKIYKFVIEDNNYNRFIFKPTDSWDGQSQELVTTIEDKALYKGDGPSKPVCKSQSNYSEPSETPGEISWYLDNDQFTKVSDGKFTLTKNMGTSDFHIYYKKEGSSKQGYNYNSDTQWGWNINDGDDRQLYKNENAMKMINGGIYLYTIYFDGSNWKMKTVKAGNAPEHVYVIGSIKDNKWNTKSTPEMTKNGSKFTLSNVELVNDGDKAKFTLITKLDSKWDVVNGSNRFGPRSESDTDASTTAANMVKEYKVGTDNVGDAKNWLIAAGTYDLVFDYDALTLTITKSGVTPPEPGELSWYLDDTKFTKVSDGEFTLTNNMGTSDFHIYKVEGSSKQSYNYNSDTQYGWDINGEVDRPLYKNDNAMKMSNGGIYLYTIYFDGSNWNMKVVPTIAVPDNLVLNYKYDNNWQTSVGMTKDGSKFTCTLKEVQQSKDYFFHFKSGDTCYQSTSDQNDAHYTNGDGRKLDFKIQNGDGKYDFKYWYGDSECDLTIEIDFATMKVTVRRSNYTGPVQPDNQYYLLGDVNNWMNDGTYTTTTNDKKYGYGYSKAENGVRADYKFIQTPINGSNNWYVLDLENTATNGRLWGQFTIIQDNGCFKAAEKEENKNDGRDVINWKGSFDQWANQYDRETATDSYKAETLKAYQSVDAAVADLNSVSQAVQGNRSNFHLDHNLYKGVKIYFNPTDQKIFMTYSDYQDFYIYLSTDADRKENGHRKVNVIKESMNNENYTLDFSSLRVVNSNGKLESDTDNEMKHVVLSKGEGDELPNGLKFTNYWKIKIPNGLEGPSGQKFVVSIDGAQDEGAKAFTSIFLNNLYFIDGVRVFATPSADVEVAAVSYRIYGLPADGDPENLQIFADDGTQKQKAVKDDPNDEFGWVDLQWGNFGYHPTSTSWWVGTVPDGYTQKTGFYPSFKDAAKTVYHEVPASHASKCIQWKITYGQRPSAANGMKKTRTGVQLNPATADLTVDRSDLNADWVLNGRHKELEIGVATGVEDIEMEDGEISEEGEAVAPVYYNLQGVRVAEPQHGLYIKVTGNKSEKILVK